MMRIRKFRGLTFIIRHRRESACLRPGGVLEVRHHKAAPPLYEIERAASHAIDSARLEGVAVEASFLHDVIDEALKPRPVHISDGTSSRREK